MAVEATPEGDRTVPRRSRSSTAMERACSCAVHCPPARASWPRRPTASPPASLFWRWWSEAMDTLFFRQPRLVMLALLVILSAGLSSLVSIGRQEDPTITNIFATVTTVFPGADPARVEALVTAKIETELRAIPEIAEVSSTSATGISVISIELIETVPPETIEQVWAQVRDAVGGCASGSFRRACWSPSSTATARAAMPRSSP